MRQDLLTKYGLTDRCPSSTASTWGSCCTATSGPRSASPTGHDRPHGPASVDPAAHRFGTGGDGRGRHPPGGAGGDPPTGRSTAWFRWSAWSGVTVRPERRHLPALRLRPEAAVVAHRGATARTSTGRVVPRRPAAPGPALRQPGPGHPRLLRAHPAVDPDRLPRRGLLHARPRQGHAGAGRRLETRLAQRAAADHHASRAAAGLHGRRRRPHRDDLRLPGLGRAITTRSSGSTSRYSKARSSCWPPRSWSRTC